MLEEIKLKINNLDYGNLFDGLKDTKDARFVYIRDDFEILDKYQDKYKLAWEELKNNLGISDEDISTSNGIDELERKYNIGSEDR